VRVRLIGVDAPETWPRQDCFGAEATRALRRLAPPGSAPRVAGDAEPYDRYRRRLLYLWTAHGVFVNAALVRAGFVRAMVVRPDTRFSADLGAAEARARHSRIGLWKACP
jgi:endonuclease YncB( thermonuclease family)